MISNLPVYTPSGALFAQSQISDAFGIITQSYPYLRWDVNGVPYSSNLAVCQPDPADPNSRAAKSGSSATYEEECRPVGQFRPVALDLDINGQGRGTITAVVTSGKELFSNSQVSDNYKGVRSIEWLDSVSEGTYAMKNIAPCARFIESRVRKGSVNQTKF
jgi:hypothetical protein